MYDRQIDTDLGMVWGVCDRTAKASQPKHCTGRQKECDKYFPQSRHSYESNAGCSSQPV